MMSAINDAIAYYSQEPNHFDECRIMRELVEELQKVTQEKDELYKAAKDFYDCDVNDWENQDATYEALGKALNKIRICEEI